MLKHFHFNIGPVQEFIAQARRSKDLWAGSFLLSYLSGVAIIAVKKQHQDNEIIFPEPDEHFLYAIQGNTDQATTPRQGRIPNRFSARVHTASQSFSPEQVINAVKSTWQEISEIVWQVDMLPFIQKCCPERKTQIESVWQYQINNFWEFSWVLTEDDQDFAAMQSRKLWPTQIAADEGGAKCMLMTHWREISALDRPGKQLNAFWQALRNQIKGGDLDFGEGENLCAIAIVKRRFGRYFEKLNLNQQTPSGQQYKIHGWSLSPKTPPPPEKEQTDQANQQLNINPTRVPALPWLAAVPWLQTVLPRLANNPEAKSHYRQYARLCKELFSTPSAHSCIASLEAIKQQHQLPDLFTSMDGECLHPKTLLNTYPNRNIRQHTQEIVEAHLELSKTVSCLPAQPFYALLAMDGDNVGKQASDNAKRTHLKQALKAFNGEVENIIIQHNGFLIYSGGDDILALLPCPDAITCAEQLRNAWQKAFRQHKGASTLHSTLSGGILFAHMKTPLQNMLNNVRQLLDDVAKEQSGRDSLAVRVYKPGGIYAQWAMPWQSLLEDGANPLTALVKNWQEPAEKISNGVIFRLIELLNGVKGWQPDTNSLNNEQIAQLTLSEFEQASKQNLTSAARTRLKQQLQQLLRLCEYHQRMPSADTTVQSHKVMQKAGKYQPDAARLVLFLLTTRCYIKTEKNGGVR